MNHQIMRTFLLATIIYNTIENTEPINTHYSQTCVAQINDDVTNAGKPSIHITIRSTLGEGKLCEEKDNNNTPNSNTSYSNNTSINNNNNNNNNTTNSTNNNNNNTTNSTNNNYNNNTTNSTNNNNNNNNNNNTTNSTNNNNNNNKTIAEKNLFVEEHNFLAKIGNALDLLKKYSVYVSVNDNAKINVIAEMLSNTHHGSKQDTFQSIRTEACLSEETIAFVNNLHVLYKRLLVDCTFIIVEIDTCGEKLAETLMDTITKNNSHACANIMRIDYTHKETHPVFRLTEVKEFGFEKHAFILLTDAVTMSTILNIAKDLDMVRYNNLWIVEKREKYTVVPFQMMAFSYTQTYKFQPIKHLHNVSNPGNSQPSSTNNIDQTFPWFSKSTEISTLVNKQWRLLYNLNTTTTTTTNNNNENSETTTQHKTDFIGLPTTNNFANNEIPIVSILEGPFLFSSHYRYNAFKRTCIDESIVCSIPLHEKRDSSGGNSTNNTTHSRPVVWQESCCFGYTADLVSSLKSLLNLKVKLYIVQDGKYGGYVAENDTYNGMVGDVLHKQAVMAIAGLTITSHRSRYVDFTAPFLRSQIGIVTLKNLKNTNYFNSRFIASITTNAKYAFLGLYVVSIALLYLLDNLTIYLKTKCCSASGTRLRPIRKTNNGRQKDKKTSRTTPPLKHYDSQEKFYGIKNNNCQNGQKKQKKSKPLPPTYYDLQESIANITGHLFQRSVTTEMPNTTTGKMFSKMLAFSMLAIVTLYVASLTADQVVEGAQNKFLGLKDPRMTHPTDEFKFGTLQDSSTLAFFRNAPDANLNRMYYFMKKYGTPSALDGIRKVLNGELQAYLGEATFADYAIAQISNDCKLETHENPVGQRSYGIAIANDSNLKYTLSQALLFLHEDGTLLQLQRKWLWSACQNIKPAHEKFDYAFFAMPMILLAACIIGSVLLLVFEIAIDKCRRKNLVKPRTR